MATPKNRGLGRGLEELFGAVEIDVTEVEPEQKPTPRKSTKKPAPQAKTKTAAKAAPKAEPKADGSSIVQIDINDIRPNEKQPRKQFDEEKLEELAASILAHGIIQPLVVRKSGKTYVLVAGERRWRAARKANLKKVPCVVRELSEEENLLLSIIENMQREDLNAMDEAEAIERIVDELGLTQDEAAKSIGKSRPYVANSLRLLKLPEEIREMVREGKLSSGHARALVGMGSAKKQLELAKRMAADGLSVREAERLSAEDEQKKPRKRSKARPPEVAAVEDELKEILGTKVNLKQQGRRGKLEIEYYNREDLERILDLLKTLKS